MTHMEHEHSFLGKHSAGWRAPLRRRFVMGSYGEDGSTAFDSQVHIPTKSERVACRSLTAISRERISKVWNPSVSTSYSTRQLRGEAPLSFRGWVDGLARLMEAGHEDIARAAVEPVLEMVRAEFQDEDSGVIRLGGTVYMLRLEKGGADA